MRLCHLKSMGSKYVFRRISLPMLGLIYFDLIRNESISDHRLLQWTLLTGSLTCPCLIRGQCVKIKSGHSSYKHTSDNHRRVFDVNSDGICYTWDKVCFVLWHMCETKQLLEYARVNSWIRFPQTSQDTSYDNNLRICVNMNGNGDIWKYK